MSHTVVVKNGTPPDLSKQSITYEKRSDGWYVDAGEGFERFAQQDASERTVEQLIRKEYDDRY